MSTYVWMRLLESAGRRYDFGIRLLSFRHVEKLYETVECLARGPEVLDVGCGTGNVSLRLARRGMRVTGVDLSPEMLDRARRKTPPGLTLRWVRSSAVELIDHFRPESFDTVTSVLLFSELSGAEQREVLRQCRLLLRPGGQFIIADEVRAPTAFRRAVQELLRFPPAVLTFLLAQETTRPVADLERKLAEASLSPGRRTCNRLGTIVVLEALKEGGPNEPPA